MEAFFDWTSDHVKVRFIVVGFLIYALIACSVSVPETDDVESSESPGTDRPKAFWGSGLTLTHKDGNIERLRITADKIVHRCRVTKLFVYENFDEIFIRSLVVEYPLPKSQRQQLSLPLQQTVNDIKSLMNFSSQDSEESKDHNNSRKDTLSRVVIEGVTFKLLPSGEPPIELSAATAEIGNPFDVIKLEGEVSIKSRDCNISGPIALWSSQYDGLLFPAGYLKEKRQHAKPIFFRLDARGRCHHVSPPPSVSYVDQIEKSETKIINKLTRGLPAYVRFMMGFGLNP